MPVETPSLFTRVIEEHLELKQRNSQLEALMPIERYKTEDPFQNHPLFKTEEQARIEETMDGEVAAPPDAHVLTWPPEETVEGRPPEHDDGLWSRSRDFDWGD